MNLVAACAFGLEAIVKRELLALGYQPKVTQPGRIGFQGEWADVARTNLWLRTADRVLVEVLKFPCADFDALFDTVKDHDWTRWLPVDAVFPVAGRSRKSQLTSVPAVQRTVKKAIVESLLREHQTATLAETGATYQIEIALLEDTATVTLDTTGASLHKRGYRILTGSAPIKETLAAAMVDLSVWNPERALVDPFCGTGTIPIEAAMIGMNIAPGINREFSFQKWADFPIEQLNQARDQAKDEIRRDLEMQIIGTDRDDDALEMARFHARKAGVEKQIHFQQKNFEDFRSKRQHGCVITNPPYGERLEDTEKLLPLYQSIPMVIQRVPTWSLYLITNMPRFERIVQKTATRRRKLYNGRIQCTYFQFLGPRPDRNRQNESDQNVVDQDELDQSEPPQNDTSPESNTPNPTAENTTAKKPKPATPPIFGGLQPKDHEQAELFRSRLLKRIRHFRRWPTKRDIHCYRLYERDIPEIPLVVDRYADHLHMTCYDRPHDRDLARDAAWLDLMKQTAASAMEIPIQRVHLKQRDEHLQQYRKVDQKNRTIEVQERDLRFLVNLTDYVDTGLFLDHRNLREMVREQSAGKDFLNLFAYTGSFSVYAASGNAKSTTSVDLSKTYLDWAGENFRVNDLSLSNHQFVSDDSIEFLRNTDQQFDLAVVDPPTYSNSKRTNNDWDVQKRHLELLTTLHGVMRPGSTVYFSSNFRRFKLDEDNLTGFQIHEISKQTVPEDFRNKRIHRCWHLSVLKQ